jgi:hypothetical protein
MIDVFSIHVWIWNTETCQSHFKKGEGKRENNGMDKLNQGTLCACMELSQWNSCTTIGQWLNISGEVYLVICGSLLGMFTGRQGRGILLCLPHAHQAFLLRKRMRTRKRKILMPWKVKINWRTITNLKKYSELLPMKVKWKTTVARNQVLTTEQ